MDATCYLALCLLCLPSRFTRPGMKPLICFACSLLLSTGIMHIPQRQMTGQDNLIKRLQTATNKLYGRVHRRIHETRAYYITCTGERRNKICENRPKHPGALVGEATTKSAKHGHAILAQWKVITRFGKHPPILRVRARMRMRRRMTQSKTIMNYMDEPSPIQGQRGESS